MKDNNYDTQQNKDLLDELFDGNFYVFVRSFVCAYHFLYNHTKNINKADKLAVALTIVFFDNLESGNMTPDVINNCLPGDSDIPLNDLITSTVIKTALTIDNETANNNEKALNESRSIIADEVMDAFSRATSLAEYKGEYNYNEILKKAADRGYINPIPQPSQEVRKENSIPFSASSSPSTSDLNDDITVDNTPTQEQKTVLEEEEGKKTLFDKFIEAFEDLQLKGKIKEAVGFFPFYFFLLPLLYYFPIEMIIYQRNTYDMTSIRYLIGVVIYVIVAITDERYSYVPSLLLWGGGLLCALMFANPFDPVTIGFYAILIIKIIVFTVRYIRYNSKKKSQTKE